MQCGDEPFGEPWRDQCNAVRFRPWPPQGFKDLARFLCHQCASVEPNGVQTPFTRIAADLPLAPLSSCAVLQELTVSALDRGTSTGRRAMRFRCRVPWIRDFAVAYVPNILDRVRFDRILSSTGRDLPCACNWLSHSPWYQVPSRSGARTRSGPMETWRAPASPQPEGLGQSVLARSRFQTLVGSRLIFYLAGD
jgi:hypothetical protein